MVNIKNRSIILLTFLFLFIGFITTGTSIFNGSTGEVTTNINACTPNWQCTTWSTCTRNMQYRYCSDKNICGTTFGKLSTSQYCSSPNPPPVPTTNTATSGTSACTSGYKCYSTKYVGYQNADCTWNGLNYCSSGCYNGGCM